MLFWFIGSDTLSLRSRTNGYVATRVGTSQSHTTELFARAERSGRVDVP